MSAWPVFTKATPSAGSVVEKFCLAFEARLMTVTPSKPGGTEVPF